MARTFTNNFLVAAASKSAKPYQILQIDWAVGTPSYYMDRPATPESFDSLDFTNRCPSTVESSLVMQWPSVSLSLKEGQVGATDQCSVVLNDEDGAITAILNASEKQRKLVTIWRMFDDSGVVWPADAARVFTGILLPFDWTSKDNQITLNLGDLGPLLAKDVSCIATSLIFGKLPQTSKDKNIPICWGQSQRVEALPISVPWETKITQSFNSGNPITVNIADHPDNMPGVTAETNYNATLGTDTVSVTFHQSTDESNTQSTATISVAASQWVASAGISVQDDGTQAPGTEPTTITLFWYAYGTIPAKRQADLQNVVQPGWTVNISDKEGGHYSTTVGSISSGMAGGLPLYTVTVPNITAGFDNSTTPPTPISLWDIRTQLNTISFFTPSNDVNPWPTGTVLRSSDTTFIYAISALPSVAVKIVEGFGSIDDASGSGRKDFVVLGQAKVVTIQNSSTTTTFSNEFTINLSDNMWSSSLGRNITTITFGRAPRDTRPNLDDNRIWCTVLGVADTNGALITNPAKVVLEYLKNPNLMNVDSGSIDSASFDAAATALNAYYVGFPQLETRPGLQLLQEIATQCNSILLFDQGKASMVVLSDTRGTDPIRATFDCGANDNLLQGSLSTQETNVSDIVNENVIKWTPFWDDITGKIPQDVRNYKPTAITAFGRISASIPQAIYLYWRRADVETQRDWWLNHKSSIFRTVAFTTFLNALILQPGDWISVQWVDGGGRDLFGGAKEMFVTKVTDTGKDGLVEIEARYVIYTYS